jgi:hypothetical protein
MAARVIVGNRGRKVLIHNGFLNTRKTDKE